MDIMAAEADAAQARKEKTTLARKNWKYHRHYLFLDLEATCAQDSGIARAEREAIEIGAVVIDGLSGARVSEFQEYIRPVVHKQLTEFCTELTGITQAQVEAAAFFPHVFERFTGWISPFEDLFIFSWGNFDQKQLKADCRRHGIAYSLPAGFLDFKNLFFKRQKFLTRMGLEATLKQVGFDFEGRPHSALSDAANTARLWPFVQQ